jgi:serine/threonine protein kinase
MAEEERLFEELAGQTIVGEDGKQFKVGRLRFKKEIKIQEALRHRGIVRIHGYHRGPEHSFAILERVYSKHSLQPQTFSPELNLPRETILEISAEVLDALNYAHGEGVIHRDVKPGNILLDDENHPHLTDFGVAKLSGDPSATSTDTSLETPLETPSKILSPFQATATADGAVVGAPAYLSPEAADFENEETEVTGASDNYSFGTTLFQVFVGELPVKEKTKMGYIKKIAQGEDKFPRDIDPTIPESIEDLILLLRAPKPEDRLIRSQGVEEAESIIDLENSMVKSGKIQEDQKFMFRPFQKTKTKDLEREIRNLEQKIRGNGNERDYVELGCRYEQLAESHPRFHQLRKDIRKLASWINYYKKWDSLVCKEGLRETRKELESIIEERIKKIMPRGHYFSQASDCYKKAGLEDQSDTMRKKVRLERRRLDHLVKTVEAVSPEKIRPTLSQRLLSPWTYLKLGAAVGVLTSLLFLGNEFIYKPSVNKGIFEQAQSLKEEAEELFKAGKLFEARDKFGAAETEYGGLPPGYNGSFLEGLGDSRDLVERAIEDSGKEKKINEYFLKLDELIPLCRFEEIEDIFAKAEAVHQALQLTPYDPVRGRLPAQASKLGRYRALTTERRLGVALSRVGQLIQNREFEKASKTFGEAELLYQGLESTPHQNIRANLPGHKVALEGHGKVLKKVDDDFRDLTTSLEKLYEFQEEVKKGSAAFVSGSLTQESLDTLLNRIDRFNRLDYIDQGNVNPAKFEEASRGYTSVVGAVNQLASGLDVNEKFLEINSILAYLEGNLFAENGMIKVSEAESSMDYVRGELKGLDSAVIPNLKGLEGRLAAAQGKLKPLKEEIVKYNGLKKKAEEGKNSFDAGKYDEAEKNLREVLESGYERLIKEHRVKTRLGLIEVWRKIEDPKNSTYRSNAQGYDTGMLGEFRVAINNYLATWAGEMEVLRCLNLVKEKTKSGAGIVVEEYGEWIQAQVEGAEGAEEGVTNYLEDRYRAAEEELGKNPAGVHPRLLERRDDLLSVLKGK